MSDEERAEFEQAYQDAIADAARTRVLDVLRNYHRIAALTRRQGAAAHRRMLDKAERSCGTAATPAGSRSRTIARQ